MSVSSWARKKQAGQSNPDIIFDAKKVLRELNNIEPGLKNQLKKDMIKIVKDSGIDDAIQSEIRSINPPIGMLTGQGRLSWNYGRWKANGSVIQPDKLSISLSASRARGYRTTNSLFSIWVKSAGVAMTGTLGKGSGVPRRTVTREYPYKGGTRQHRVTTQGSFLIQRVKSKNFNWFYKTSEGKFPSVQRQVKLVWEQYANRVSKRL